MTKCTIAAMTGCVLSLATAAPALAEGADGLSGSVGADFSSGTYGGETNTDIVVAPFTLRYRTGNIRVTATLPLLDIGGSSAVVGDDGVVIDPDAPPTSRRGVGDMTIGAAYAIPESKLGVGIEFGVRIKVPTASRAKALGTGKVDYALSTEISKTLGNLTPFLTIGYRIPGQPKGADLRKSWSTSVGSSLIVGKSVLIASYDFRQASSRLARDGHELFGAFSTPLSSRLTLTVYGTGGLSEGAAAYGLGSSVSMKL